MTGTAERPGAGGGAAGSPADAAHIELSYVVALYFNQADTASLTDLLRLYAAYPPAVLDRLQFVLVDDGSPVRAVLPPELDLNLLLLRVTVDIPWNQPGARNLGVVCARSDKVLLTDLDHEFSADTLAHMIRRRNPGRTMYKLRRVRPDGRSCASHPNTFLLSRARFLRLYGYDEDFSGHYGYDDSLFWRWQRNHGTRFLYLPRPCRAQLRQFDTDRSYHSLARDTTFNAEVARRKKALWRVHGGHAGHSRRFLCFPWEVVEDRRRSSVPAPAADPLWTRLWWWRWLVGGP